MMFIQTIQGKEYPIMSTYRFKRGLVPFIFAVAFCLIASTVAAEVIKIGASACKTGPLAGGAAVTHWPNIKLWAHKVNEAGGLQLKDGKARIEIVEYDDRTTPEEAIKNIQRMATQDKVDFIIPPYGTGLVLATAPLMVKHGYPIIACTAINDKIPELTQRYSNLFFTLGDSSNFAGHVVKILSKMREEGKIGNRVAMVNVADAFGIELANVGRPAFKAAGFDIVYDKSYPMGTQDLSPVIKGAKASNPDAFVAFSYPPDTFGLTEQAKIEDFNVKAFYTAVATAFPAFAGKFGKSAEGILGAGGVNPDTPEMQAYIKEHTAVTGVAPDYWASAVMYASLQILGQAIEGVGSKDREAIIAYLKNNTFNTVMGPVDFVNQNNEKFWTVGQWQGGKFYGVSSTGRPGAKPVILKPAW